MRLLTRRSISCWHCCSLSDCNDFTSRWMHHLLSSEWLDSENISASRPSVASAMSARTKGRPSSAHFQSRTFAASATGASVLLQCCSRHLRFLLTMRWMWLSPNGAVKSLWCARAAHKRKPQNQANCVNVTAQSTNMPLPKRRVCSL